MPEEWIAFTLRLPPKEYETLRSLARLRGVSIAALAREILLEQFSAATDPDEIERQVNTEKRRLMEAADAIRKRREQGES